jgi:hypothetical protein
MNPFAATHRKDLPNHTATPYFLRSPFINFPIPTPSMGPTRMLFGSHEHPQEIEPQWRRSRRRPFHHENGFVFSNHLFEFIARAPDASITFAGPALLAGVGFVFSNRPFGSLPQITMRRTTSAPGNPTPGRGWVRFFKTLVRTHRPGTQCVNHPHPACAPHRGWLRFAKRARPRSNQKPFGKSAHSSLPVHLW